MATDVSLLAELLGAIFQDNRELLLELHIGNVISNSRKENPALGLLDISEGLEVSAASMPNDQSSQLAIVSLIFTVKEYIEVLEGAAVSDRCIGTAVSGFTARHDAASLESLRRSFPELFKTGSTATEIDNLDELGKVRDMFSAVLRHAARELPAGRDGVLGYLRKCASVKSVTDDMNVIDFSENLTAAAALDLLSDAVEKLAMPQPFVKRVLEPYGSAPEELGVLARLFGGALSSTAAFGCEPIDRHLRDGLKREVTLLLEGPAGSEKEILASLFLAEGIRTGGCAIIVSAVCPTECLRNGLASSGLDPAKAESEGRLIFVDWHSRFTERVTSIDATGNILKVSNDLTNLAVAIDMALRMADGKPHMRMVLDIASTTIITEGFDRVHEFLNSVRAKMKNHSCTGLVLLNPHMHTADQVNMLEEIFDGTMAIERSEAHGRFQSSFRIVQLSGSAFSPARLSMSVTHRGLEMSDGESPPLLIDYDHGDEKAILGLMGIETLTQGGLPLGRSFLVWIPSSMVPADFVKPVVMEAQKEGHALLLALSSMDTETVGGWMSEKGLSRKGLIDRGLLQVVDWYGQKSAKVLGMELDEGIIRTSRDLTHLGVGIDMALRKISDQYSSLAVAEFLSQAIRQFDMRSVYSFAQSVNAKLAGRGFTTFMLMERDAHESMANAAMEELFDGIIDIRSSGGIQELAIVSLRGSHFQSEYRPLSKLRDRLSIDVARRIPDSEIVETMAGHGLAARLKSLEGELERTLADKAALERRLAEFSGKETEYEKSHREMRAAIELLEARMAGMVPAPEDGEATVKHKEELARLFKVIDTMLENLPEDVVNEFAKSEDFRLYEKILDMYLEEGK